MRGREREKQNDQQSIGKEEKNSDWIEKKQNDQQYIGKEEKKMENEKNT